MPTPNDIQMSAWAEAAVAGDSAALEELLRALKDPLFRLALRILGHFADAEDVTQEILVKITTSLSGFAGRSSIRTWAYRIALNHATDLAQAKRAHHTESFEALAEKLEAGQTLADSLPDLAGWPDPALEAEAREMGLRCTQGMLMCLDVPSRTAFVLGEVFDLDSRTGAQVLNIEEAAYRQRLSRARRQLESFMQGRCGLVDPKAPCRCQQQSRAARTAGLTWPLQFSTSDSQDAVDLPAVMAATRNELSRLQRIGLVFRTHPNWQAPEELVTRVREALQASPLLEPRGGPTA
jgi:RNA polymerase sigma factor (sigma-70 family)